MNNEIIIGGFERRDPASNKQIGRIEIARAVPQGWVFLRIWSVGEKPKEYTFNQHNAAVIGEALLKAAQKPMTVLKGNGNG